MEDKPTGKRDAKINAFKAPAEWREMVRAIAAKRHSTISSTILRLVELGAPVHEKLRELEPAAIAEAVAALKRLRAVPEVPLGHKKPVGKRG